MTQPYNEDDDLGSFEDLRVDSLQEYLEAVAEHRILQAQAARKTQEVDLSDPDVIDDLLPEFDANHPEHPDYEGQE